jgi:hypothetical protein
MFYKIMFSCSQSKTSLKASLEEKSCAYKNLRYGDFDSQDSSVNIKTGYGLDGRGSIPGRGKRFFCFPQRPDGLWSPPRFLYIGKVASFRGGKAAGT